jgi:hypothetical protein
MGVAKMPFIPHVTLTLKTQYAVYLLKFRIKLKTSLVPVSVIARGMHPLSRAWRDF